MDCKVTINKFVKTDHYSLPLIEDILVDLRGSKYFAILDLSGAFSQLEVSAESQKYLTLNTPRGLFRYTRLPFGVKSAPAAFQAVMDSILRGIKWTRCYIDDIIVGGSSLQECASQLDKVLERFDYYNVKVKSEKCIFFETEVDYLGYTVNEEGIKSKIGKVEAISHAPRPTDVTTLKSYLGLLNFYSKFIPNVSSRSTN